MDCGKRFRSHDSVLPFIKRDDSHVGQCSTPLLLFFFFFFRGNGNSSLCVKFVPWKKKKECCRAHVPSGPFKEAFKVWRRHSVLCPSPPQSPLKNSPEKKLHVGISCAFPAQERSGGNETGRPMSSPLLSVN